MSEIIDLRPSMKKRLMFDHPLFDDADDYKVPRDQVADRVALYLENRAPHRRDELILGFMWLAKDLVARFRAHWPEVRPMTDDLCSEALAAVTVFFDELQSGEQIFNKLQGRIRRALREYINNNRSAFSSSHKTNERREKNDQPLEYNFAIEHNDELNGELVTDPLLVDILDEVEHLSDIDQEEMRDLVLQFLEQNHNISESELSDEERESLEKLTQLVRNLK
jgi:hypothetical protein